MAINISLVCNLLKYRQQHGLYVAKACIVCSSNMEGVEPENNSCKTVYTPHMGRINFRNVSVFLLFYTKPGGNIT